MDWQQLISNKRLGQEDRHALRHDDRSEFKRDSDRLIYSAPFRRLQNKTQVFPLPGSVFVHNRLTHSLEVASLGKSLGDDVARKLTEVHPELRGTLFEEIGTIVQTACYAHDMGNPPFGHSGEKAIQAFFTEGPGAGLEKDVSRRFWDDITHFEGNANAFRLLTHRFLGRREGGFVMTYSTLASIVKYPFSSSYAGKHGKFGFFATEEKTYQKIADELGIIRKDRSEMGICYVRHPLTYLMEAADDICYEIMDIEDSHKLKLLSSEETADLLLGFFDEHTRQGIRQRIVDEGVTGHSRGRSSNTSLNSPDGLTSTVRRCPKTRFTAARPYSTSNCQAIRSWRHSWKPSSVLPQSRTISTASSSSTASPASTTSRVPTRRPASWLCSTISAA